MPATLQVDFWDVGFGDISVIWIDTNRVILVDSGPGNSQLPQWLEQKDIYVDLVIITHNDRDHFQGLDWLVRRRASNIRAVGVLQDRSANELVRNTWVGLIDWVERYDGNLFRIECAKGKSQDILKKGKVTRNPFGDLLRLDAVYPSLVNNIKDQREQKPNYASAIIVLWFCGKPVVVWPGDQRLRTCQKELQKQRIHPNFLVGPHHGGPQDSNLSIDEMDKLVRGIGHNRSWISVAWRENYGLPNPDYLICTSQKGIKIQCSQLTPHCHKNSYKIGNHLLKPPTCERFAIPKSPNNGSSCMGSMRVKFHQDGYEILYDEEHKTAVNRLDHPLCKYN